MPVGGVRAMLAGIVLSGLLCGVLTLILAWIDHGLGRREWRRDRETGGTAGSAGTAGPRPVRWGWAIATGLFWWSVAAVLLVTLLPLDSNPGWIEPEDRRYGCSFDIGGPAPEGFWRIPGDQRTLNAAIFVPSGVLWVWSVWRHRLGRWLLVPFGAIALAGLSVGIETLQMLLARLDRSCDVTDMIDNTAGALIGLAIGLVLALTGSGLRRAFR